MKHRLLTCMLLVSILSAPAAAGQAAGAPGPAASPAGPVVYLPLFLKDPGPIQWPQLAFVAPVGGLDHPLHITHMGDGSGRIVVVEQPGRVRLVKSGQLLATPFLDITDRVLYGGEQGLLSVAFPPGYAQKGYFYAYYVDKSGQTVVARYHTSPDPDVANPASEEALLTLSHPSASHYGGQLAFGPKDGYLYISIGDGGLAGDPTNNAQNPALLLGKLLRIDAESLAKPYAIPSSNPFTQTIGYRGEIWALGLRNPWRFSFDRQSGDLFIGDPGHLRYEEVDYQRAASPGGENYGWRIMEGSHCFDPVKCSWSNLTLPLLEYTHLFGCAVIGGVTYRGTVYPKMQGIYVYGDNCTGRVWGLAFDGTDWRSSFLQFAPAGISSFGEDEAGNIYLADIKNGFIYKITDASTP